MSNKKRGIERHELEVVHQTEPVIAYKTARWHSGCVFAPIVRESQLYGIEGTAKCNYRGYFDADQGHIAPMVNCECGFYAFKRRHSAYSRSSIVSNSVILKVELSGRVIEGWTWRPYGYRAEKQKVIGIYTSRSNIDEMQKAFPTIPVRSLFWPRIPYSAIFVGLVPIMIYFVTLIVLGMMGK